MVLANLKPGDRALITKLGDDSFANQLLEMGCIPGAVVEVLAYAPLGDPIMIRVSGYKLSIRKKEARAISVQSVSPQPQAFD